MIFKSSKVYDICKYIGRIFLPATLALILGLGELFGWNTGLIGTVGSLVITFFNTVLQIDYAKWYNSYIAELPEDDNE